MTARGLCWLLVFASTLAGAEEYSIWIDPCTAEAASATGCQAGDPELGRWAFEAWQRETEGGLKFTKSPSEAHARIKLHWANGAAHLYGETEPAMVDGKRGAVIYVLPAGNTNDPLLRDAIVYLTCVHESGHALGLRHTDAFADIMYTFGYGGDIAEYFGRYRRLLKTRADIARHSGISDADRVAISFAFPK